MSQAKHYTWVTTRRMERERAERQLARERGEGRPIEPRPSNIRVYDNGGETADRFTIVNTKSYTYRGVRYYPYATSSEDPFHPQGIGMTNDSKGRPMEKRPEEKTAKWADLPPNVRKFAIQVSRHHLEG